MGSFSHNIMYTGDVLLSVYMDITYQSISNTIVSLASHTMQNLRVTGCTSTTRALKHLKDFQLSLPLL